MNSVHLSATEESGSDEVIKIIEEDTDERILCWKVCASEQEAVLSRLFQESKKTVHC